MLSGRSEPWSDGFTVNSEYYELAQGGWDSGHAGRASVLLMTW